MCLCAVPKRRQNDPVTDTTLDFEKDARGTVSKLLTGLLSDIPLGLLSDIPLVRRLSLTVCGYQKDREGRAGLARGAVNFR